MIAESMRCRKHKKYKGIRIPRIDCDGCWCIYKMKGHFLAINNLMAKAIVHKIIVAEHG